MSSGSRGGNRCCFFRVCMRDWEPGQRKPDSQKWGKRRENLKQNKTIIQLLVLFCTKNNTYVEQCQYVLEKNIFKFLINSKNAVDGVYHHLRHLKTEFSLSKSVAGDLRYGGRLAAFQLHSALLKSSPFRGRWHGKAVTDEVMVRTATRIALPYCPHLSPVVPFFCKISAISATSWNTKSG